MTFSLDGPGGDFLLARKRKDLTRLIYEIFPDLSSLRHALSKQQVWQPEENKKTAAFIPKALANRILRKKGSGYYSFNNVARSYLLGAWLEEFIALALYEAECEDIRFSQHIIWQASTDASTHANEIDAMAIAGKSRILVSCKAVAEDILEKRKGEERLFDALLELSYWNAHFGGDNGIPIFVTTADFYDEARQSFRSSKLVERANVLGIKVMPADFGNYESFVLRLKSFLKKHTI